MSTENTFSIPDTIEGVRAALGGVAADEAQMQYLMKRCWQRAAIVWAWTYEPGSGGDHTSAHWKQSKKLSFAQMTCRDFAKEMNGLRGVANHVSVLEFRRDWQDAIDRGAAQPVQPGDTGFMVPDEPYPPARRGGFQHGMTADTPTPQKVEATKKFLAKNPEVKEALVDEIIADPVVEKRLEHKFVQRAGRDTLLKVKVDNAYDEHHPVPIRKQDDNFLEVQVVMGLGSSIYVDIQREVRKDLDRVIHYLTEYPPSENEMMKMRYEALREDLTRCHGLLADIEGRLDQAVGVDYDAVFRQAVKGQDR